MNVGLRARRHYNATISRDCVSKHTFSHVCHIIRLSRPTRCLCFRNCLQLNTKSYNRPFVGTTSILVLNTRLSWSLFRQCAKIQKYIYDYDTTKGTLIEIEIPYPHTPITKHLSGIPDTSSLLFWCVFKFLHMQFRLRCRLNIVSVTDNHQCSHRLMNSEKLHCNGAS